MVDFDVGWWEVAEFTDQASVVEPLGLLEGGEFAVSKVLLRATEEAFYSRGEEQTRHLLKLPLIT